MITHVNNNLHPSAKARGSISGEKGNGNGHSSSGQALSGLRPIDKTAEFLTKKLLSDLPQQYPGKVHVAGQLDLAKLPCHVACTSAPIQMVAVQAPTYLDWDPKKPLNGREMENADQRPDRSKAVKQHENFVRTLLNLGVEVVVLPPSPSRLEGTFTCDIVFVIGDKAFAANMVSPVRQPEEATVINGIKPPAHIKIEGGNVLPYGDFVFLGVGDRTSEDAPAWLQGELGDSKLVIPLHLKTTQYDSSGRITEPGILHADCVFLPLDKGRALIHEPAFTDPEEVKLVKKIFGGASGVHPSEVPILGLNAPCVNPDTRLVSKHAARTIEQLKEWKYQVVAVDMSEMIKAEGGPNCSMGRLFQA
ncbi:MAG: hypothetical protein KGH63_02315 [Candidatus Micrarchaeota archaeon]|nr:hypothetical protein [Candidatus Micrarchaeota archaeon]